MSLLTSLPNVLYNINPASTDPTFILAKNIWRRAQILAEFKNKISLFSEYIVKDGETPEQIAFDRYDDPFLNWTILIANDIVNYHDQWPRSAVSLNEYVLNKYTNAYAIKHYVTTEVKDSLNNILLPAGKIIPETFTFSYIDSGTGSQVSLSPKASVTYYQYEQQENEKKEKIQIIRPDLIEDFVSAYQRVLVRGSNTTFGISNDDIEM
tara:strand:- start:103 stop:729 length:627 start_codon:yes stop_codon:yes gene_type:complete